MKIQPLFLTTPLLLPALSGRDPPFSKNSRSIFARFDLETADFFCMFFIDEENEANEANFSRGKKLCR
jgi:hypothetical protein